MVAIYALTAPAAESARRLATAWPQSRIFLPWRLVRPEHSEQGFERFGDILSENFMAYGGHLVFAASGIVVRALAGLIQGKEIDPAVVVLDPAGHYAISLLSGHLGGANQLAIRAAELLGGQAVITTATDQAKLPSLEMVATRQRLKVENLKALSAISRQLVEGERVPLYDPENWLWPALAGHQDRFKKSEQASTAEPMVWVDWRNLPAPASHLVLRPACLAVGIGCNRGTSVQEMRALLDRVFAEQGLALGSLRCLATVEAKRDEAGITELGEYLGTMIQYYKAAELEAVEVPHPSLAARKHVGTKSVCEAAALLAAGADRLLVTKQKSKNATLAVAKLARRDAFTS